MHRESKATAGVCQTVEAEYKESIGLPSLSCIELLLLSLAESDSALVVSSLVAESGRFCPDINLRFQEELKVRVCR